jgi:phytanoyl-CoA dioxygenase PhyH
MHVPDDALDQLRTDGYTLVEGFLGTSELEEAREGLWVEYPRPDDYFADPAQYEHLVRDQFSGVKLFPYQSWAINRLAFHPDLVDAAERFLGTAAIDLYKVELWAKYSGTVNYSQPLHRDFGSHNLVVPRRDGRWPHLTSFIMLSDVTELDGPTKLVPLQLSGDVPLVIGEEDPSFFLPPGPLADAQISATGPAGTLLLYTNQVLHRGSQMRGERRSRFALLADYKIKGTFWAGKMCWPNQAIGPAFREVMERASVRERDLFGFPPPGHEYWNEQTLADVQLRYPRMDMSEYRAKAP